MKRMFKYAILFILAAVIPLTASIGQEKKDEQKIKVVINDGSGEKTVLDTTFTGENIPHKINLKDGKVIFIGEPGEKMIHILSDGKVIDNAGGKTFDIRVETDDNDTDVEKTKYVIAKDGFVVTVEGNDEAKAKELIKEIESKLGVKEEGNVKNEVVKEETKKSVKK